MKTPGLRAIQHIGVLTREHLAQHRQLSEGTLDSAAIAAEYALKRLIKAGAVLLSPIVSIPHEGAPPQNPIR